MRKRYRGRDSGTSERGKLTNKLMENTQNIKSSAYTYIIGTPEREREIRKNPDRDQRSQLVQQYEQENAKCVGCYSTCVERQS